MTTYIVDIFCERPKIRLQFQHDENYIFNTM